MKLERLSFEGITRFESAVEVDFAALGPGLVAVTGPNGAGKTTLLECSMPAALWRELPTRPEPTLANWIGPKGGSLSLKFMHGGREYLSVLKFPAKGIAQAYLYEDGEPISSGKLKDYDVAVKARFGTAEAFYASAFAMQGGKGRFASMSVADRRSVFRFYLGLDRIDAIGAAHESLRKAHIDVGEKLSSREAVIARLEALKSQATLSAQVKTYREAIADVLAAEDKAKAAEAATAVEIGDPGPDPEQALAELESARALDDEINALERDLEVARRALADADRVLEDARRRAAELGDVPCAGAAKFASCKFLQEAVESKKKLPELEKKAAELSSDVADKELLLVEGTPDCAHDLAKLSESYKSAVRHRRAYEDAQARLDVANATAKAANDNLAAARRRAMSLRRALPTPLPEVPDADELERVNLERRIADHAYDAALAARATAEASIASLASSGRELAAELYAAQKDATDAPALQLLTRGFGPTGIQALEIDAAGPRVSELANALIRACYGERFRVDLKTQRDLKSRDGVAEDFSVQICDLDRGREGALASLSGGEQVIVDEALRTALSLFVIESRAGKEPLTLWRDETPAALYGENVGRYLTMLQQAREIGGFHQVLFVGGPLALDAADAVVEVTSDGQVKSRRL